MAPTAPDALLCGDPARALAIAQRVLTKPVMSNHHRGLWGYHGTTAAGAELTVQATGIGGPSAAVVLDELLELGVRRLIRIGTCFAAADEPALGAALVVDSALAGDGTSAALGAAPNAHVYPDRELRAALLAATGAEAVTVASADTLEKGVKAPLAPVRDLQTAAVLRAAERAGAPAAAALTVISAAGRRLEDDPLEASLLRLADAAAAAFATLEIPKAEVEA